MHNSADVIFNSEFVSGSVCVIALIEKINIS